jgi:hypothetical protein
MNDRFFISMLNSLIKENFIHITVRTLSINNREMKYTVHNVIYYHLNFTF